MVLEEAIIILNIILPFFLVFGVDDKRGVGRVFESDKFV